MNNKRQKFKISLQKFNFKNFVFLFCKFELKKKLSNTKITNFIKKSFKYFFNITQELFNS